MSTITHFSSAGTDLLTNGAAVTGTVADPQNGAVTIPLYNTVTSSVLADTSQKVVGTASAKLTLSATSCFASTASMTLISNYAQIVCVFAYRPESMSFSAGDQHSLLHNSTFFDVIVNHTGGIKARARVLDGANAMVVQTAQSSVLSNNTWYRMILVYTKVSGTQGAVDLYIDGTLVGSSGTGSHTPPGATTTIRLGSSAPSGGSGTVTAGVFYLDKVNIASMNTVPDLAANRGCYLSGVC